MESDHSEGSAPESAPTRQSSVALSHPESEEEEEMAEEEEEVEGEEVMDGEEEMEEDETNREDESSAEDATDGASLSLSRQRTGGSSGSSRSSRGSSEEMRSPSPDESLEQTSTVSEDAEELEGSLDGSQGSRLKQRSVLKRSRCKD